MSQSRQAHKAAGHKHLLPCLSLTCRVRVQITHPLSVSYNKLGDLEYGLGNVEAAEGWYQKGLAVRQQALGSRQKSDPNQQLDVAVSMIKVADANQVCDIPWSVKHDSGCAQIVELWHLCLWQTKSCM